MQNVSWMDSERIISVDRLFTVITTNGSRNVVCAEWSIDRLLNDTKCLSSDDFYWVVNPTSVINWQIRKPTSNELASHFARSANLILEAYRFCFLKENFVFQQETNDTFTNKSQNSTETYNSSFASNPHRPWRGLPCSVSWILVECWVWGGDATPQVTRVWNDRTTCPGVGYASLRASRAE